MKIQYENRWLSIRDKINEKGVNGNKVVEALQDYYSIFEDKMLIWLGGLFEPQMGGFYFSESARDNEFVAYKEQTYKLLPDIESTSQAIQLLYGNEIFNDQREIPEWMKNKIASFICERQDEETGFFYHPQWPKKLTDSKVSRRSRDLTWAISLSKKFKFKLPYLTAIERLESKKENTETNEAMPEHLRDEDAFLKYLKSFDWDNEAYPSANKLSAQGLLIRASGLGKVATDFLGSIQNPKTGFWGKDETPFSATNAYMKVSMLYRKLQTPTPNAHKVLPVMFERTTEPIEYTECCVAQYNILYAVHNIISDMRSFGGVEGKELVDKAIIHQLKNCIEPIRCTKEKALIFKKSEGCFSWSPHKTSGTSQGMPVAILGTNEGDINANGICSFGTADLLLYALGIDSWIPIFSENSYDIFMSALKTPQL